jgi:uncharacterized lipoprotein YddW (UPF0748 family)
MNHGLGLVLVWLASCLLPISTGGSACSFREVSAAEIFPQEKSVGDPRPSLTPADTLTPSPHPNRDTNPGRKTRYRGIYLHVSTNSDGTPYDYESDFALFAKTGITDVFPISAGINWTYGQSDLGFVETQSKQSGYKDVVAEWIRLGKKYGLRTHLWVCPFDPVSSSFQSMQKAGLLLRDASGNTTVDGKAWKRWANPQLEENRRMALAVIAELVERYKPDGLMLDYIRYPERRYWFGRNDKQEFAKYVSAKVDPFPDSVMGRGRIADQWTRWHVEVINRFVKEAYTTAHQRKPNIIVSAFHLRHDPMTLQRRFAQAPGEWVNSNTIDMLNPSVYSNGVQEVVEFARYQLPISAGRVPMLASVNFSMDNRAKRLRPPTAEELQDQLDVLRDLGYDGFILFVWKPKFRHVLESLDVK